MSPTRSQNDAPGAPPASTATPGMLCVSIHDVAPATWADCLRLVQAVRAVADIPLTWLVVPHYHFRPEQSLAMEACLNVALERGDELALHGYSHLDTEANGGGLRTRFLRGVYTRREGEFAALSEAEAQRRLELGLDWFAERGWTPSGFVPPAWLLGEGAWRALRAAPFTYTTTFSHFHCLPGQPGDAAARRRRVAQDAARADDRRIHQDRRGPPRYTVERTPAEPLQGESRSLQGQHGAASEQRGPSWGRQDGSAFQGGQAWRGELERGRYGRQDPGRRDAARRDPSSANATWLDQARGEWARTDQVRADRANGGPAHEDQARADQVGADQVGADKAYTDHVSADQTRTDQVHPYQARIEPPRADQARADCAQDGLDRSGRIDPVDPIGRSGASGLAWPDGIDHADQRILRPSTSILSPSLVYAARNRSGRFLSPRIADITAAMLAQSPLVRFSLHPPDARYPELVRHIQRTLERLLMQREAVTKAECARRLTSTDPIRAANSQDPSRSSRSSSHSAASRPSY